MSEVLLGGEAYPVISSTFQERLAQKEQAHGIVPASELRTSEDRLTQYSKLRGMIGRTPLLHYPYGDSNIWIKVESENPTESHYDRATLNILQTLEGVDFIRPGDRLVEGTSGSAGRSFIYYTDRLGFNLDMLLYDELFTQHPARVRDMQVFSANLINTGEGGIASVVRAYGERILNHIEASDERKTYRMGGGKASYLFTAKDGSRICFSNHAESIITPNSFGAIAREVTDELPEGIAIDTFIGTLGNGSTVKGITEVLRENNPDLKVLGTETVSAPTNAIRKIESELAKEEGYAEEDFKKEGSTADKDLRSRFMDRYGFPMPTLAEQTFHDTFGASVAGYRPPFIDVDRLDHIVLLGDEWRTFHRRHNLYAWLLNNVVNAMGHSSAENLYVARQWAKMNPGSNILVLFYDKGDQYQNWPPQLRTYQYPLKREEAEETIEIPYYLQQLKAV